MAKKVSIPQLIEEMEAQIDEMPVFFNKENGKYAVVRERYLVYVENGRDLEEFSKEKERKQFKLAKEILTTDKYLRIPTNFDIYEWEVMNNFCNSIEDDSVREDLLDAINGSGAFQAFREKIRDHDISQDWLDFKKKRFTEIAKQWCKGQGIGYIEA